MATPQKQQVSPWFWIAVGTAIVLMMIFLRDSDPAGDNGTTSSPREDCEYQWDLNRDTAESPFMDRQTYVENCLETARDLEDGTLDGN